MKDAYAFLAAQITGAQQPAEMRPALAVLRIGKNIGRAVRKH